MSEVGSWNSESEPCERCGSEIHSIEPATSIKFSGGVDSETRVVCHDCIVEVIEWWNEGDAVADNDEDRSEADR